MSVHEKGYLSLNIPGERYIEISIYSISLVLQFAITILAISKIRRNPQISTPLSACFAASSSSVCSYTVSSILFHIDHFDDITILYKITTLIWSSSIFWFFLSLLCTVILKLYLTFKSSIYRMSSTMISLFTVIVLLCIIISLMFHFVVYGLECSNNIRFSLFALYGVVYLLGCSLAVYSFVKTLFAVTKTQETSFRNLNVAPEKMKLKPQQQKLVDLAMKSMILFAIQIASTICITSILSFAFPWSLRDATYVIDLTINYLCAYLQFAFATKHYRKCCGFCDDKFRGIMLKRIKREIANHLSSQSQPKTVEASVPSQSPSTSRDEVVV